MAATVMAAKFYPLLHTTQPGAETTVRTGQKFSSCPRFSYLKDWWEKESKSTVESRHKIEVYLVNGVERKIRKQWEGKKIILFKEINSSTLKTPAARGTFSIFEMKSRKKDMLTSNFLLLLLVNLFLDTWGTNFLSLPYWKVNQQKKLHRSSEQNKKRVRHTYWVIVLHGSLLFCSCMKKSFGSHVLNLGTILYLNNFLLFFLCYY